MIKFISLSQSDSEYVIRTVKSENALYEEFYGYAKQMGLSDQFLVFSQSDTQQVTGFRPIGWKNIQSLDDVQFVLGEDDPLRSNSDFEIIEKKYDILISPSKNGQYSDIRQKMEGVEFTANSDICKFLGLKPHKEFEMKDFGLSNTVRYRLGIYNLEGFTYIAYEATQGIPTKGNSISEEAFEHITGEVPETI